MKITLKTSELAGLRARVRHRLYHRHNQLSAKEHDFLMSMDDHLARATSLSEKQLEWLLDLLERTQTAAAPGGAAADEVPPLLSIRHEGAKP